MCGAILAVEDPKCRRAGAEVGAGSTRKADTAEECCGADSGWASTLQTRSTGHQGRTRMSLILLLNSLVAACEECVTDR